MKTVKHFCIYVIIKRKNKFLCTYFLRTSNRKIVREGIFHVFSSVSYSSKEVVDMFVFVAIRFFNFLLFLPFGFARVSKTL